MHTGASLKIPLRLYDLRKLRKFGKGYTPRERTVVELLKELSQKGTVKSFLNIGFHDYQDTRNRWWIDICRANGIEWHVLEIYGPNVERFKQRAPKEDHHRITQGDVKDIAKIFDHNFDVILHWHGPEHLPREDFLEALPGLEERSEQLLILGCPNGPEEQGSAYRNPHEEHVSFWSQEDFQSLGFETQALADRVPGHITAHKYFI